MPDSGVGSGATRRSYLCCLPPVGRWRPMSLSLIMSLCRLVRRCRKDLGGIRAPVSWSSAVIELSAGDFPRGHVAPWLDVSGQLSGDRGGGRRAARASSEPVVIMVRPARIAAVSLSWRKTAP